MKKEKKTANIKFITSMAAQKAGEKREQAMNGSLIKVTYTSTNVGEKETQKSEEAKDQLKVRSYKEHKHRQSKIKFG